MTGSGLRVLLGVLAAVALAVPTAMTTGVVALLLALDIDGRLAESVG